MNSSVVNLLWAYAAIVLAGGVMGFVKAGSRISLVVSLVAAVVVALVALGRLPLVVAQVEMGLLIGVFVSRYARTRKPMPAFPMIGLSAVALALTFVLGRG
ncbi:MAG: hypothetical protein DVB31_08360 [Verrucomicrobia bacterium]|nr:MAG: hypothetical protein DVB31_08360 [Verrucomicrobiota bacterium]